jgi:protein TonB
MPTHALAQGGLRPADALPPTLQPNAVLLAAPPSARGLSLLTACLVYCVIGSGLLLAARERVLALAAGPRFHPVVWDFEPAVRPEPPRFSPPRAGGDGSRSAAGETVTPPAAVPDATPATLNSRDLSHSGPATAELPVVKGGTGPGTQIACQLPYQPVSAPVTVELKDLRVLHQVQPVYPALARAIRAQGPVLLLMTVDAMGVPTEVQILSGPHPALMAEAERVARLWRFEPARVDGRAVPAQFRLTVLFRLS